MPLLACLLQAVAVVLASHISHTTIERISRRCLNLFQGSFTEAFGAHLRRGEQDEDFSTVFLFLLGKGLQVG